MFSTRINRLFVRLTTIELLFLMFSGECRLLGSEPIYQGEPESYWVDLLANLDSAPFATQWQTLGSNTIPVLIKALEKKDGPNASTIRTNAAFILSRNSDPKTLVAIASLALTYNIQARSLILPAVVKCLLNPDPEVCLGAARLLSHYYPYPPEDQNQGEVDKLACAEIEKAANNSDPHISNAASVAVRRGEQVATDEKKRHSVDFQGEQYEIFLMAKKNHAVLDAYARELAIYLSELHGTKWTATIHVFDDEDKPVQGASVNISYAILPGHDLDAVNDFRKIEGLTDSNGLFSATHIDSSRSIGIEVKKDNYYRVRAYHEFAFPGQFDSEKMAVSRNPVATFAIKKVIRPVPMYVNRVDIAHREKPSMDKPVGFDLTIGDFVSPYGKGTNAQMYFTWHADYITNEFTNYFGKGTSRGKDGRMIISFPNQGDGIIEFDLPSDKKWTGFEAGSDLRSPQLAPVDGYQSQLVKTNRWNFGKLKSINDYDHLHKNWFFDVRNG